MITRDFIVRQIHQLAQVLAVVLLHKRAGRQEEAQQTIAEGLEDALGLSLAALYDLDRASLLARCTSGTTFFPEKALALADLLREDATRAGRERALWLYEAARDAGEIVPLDIDARIADLRQSLEPPAST